jgi:hypothetical protein
MGRLLKGEKFSTIKMGYSSLYTLFSTVSTEFSTILKIGVLSFNCPKKFLLPFFNHLLLNKGK